MMSADLGKCVELTTLYSSLLGDIKSGSLLWEDVINRGGKLSAILRAAVHASNSFFDSVQRLADLASKTTGGSKEIGASLTRLCMRQKRLGTKLKSMSNQLVTCLANPLSSRLDDWKRTVSQIEKQHSREVKRARAELKRAVAEANRLQRKLSKHESGSKDSSGGMANQGIGHGVGLGQPPPPQPPSRPASTSRGSRAFATTSSLAVQTEAALQAIEDKARRLEDVERASIRRLMLAERGRYCFFFDSLKPTLESETSLLNEISNLEELLQALTVATEHPDQLLDEAEAILARAGSRVGNVHRSPRSGHSLGAPVLGDKTSQEDAFAAAAAAIIFNRNQQQQQQHMSSDRSADCTTSGQSREIGNVGQISASQAGLLSVSISDRNSLSAYSGSTNSTGGYPVTAANSSAVLRNGFSSSGSGCGHQTSSQISMPNDSISSASSGPHLPMFSSQSQQHSHQGANLRSESVDRHYSQQSGLNTDGGPAAVILRRPNTGTPVSVSDTSRTLTMFCPTSSSTDPATSSTNSTVFRDPLSAASMYNESLESCCTTTAGSTLLRYSTTTLQLPAPLGSNEEAEEEEEDGDGVDEENEENEGYGTEGDVTADSEGDITAENVTAATISGHLSATDSLKSGRHTISSTYDRALAGAKRTPIAVLTAERRSVSRNGDTNAMLYPEQSLPPPVYANLNQLAHAAQRKFSMSTSSCSSGTAATPAAKSSIGAAAGAAATGSSTTVHQRQISPAPQPPRSEDTVSIASAPARQPSSSSSSAAAAGAGATPCIAPGDYNARSGGAVASIQPAASSLLHSAPGSPRHHLLPLNAGLSQQLAGAPSQPPNSAPPIGAAFGGAVIPNSVSGGVSEDPFSLEMDELDRMVAELRTISRAFTDSGSSTSSLNRVAVSTKGQTRSRCGPILDCGSDEVFLSIDNAAIDTASSETLEACASEAEVLPLPPPPLTSPAPPKPKFGSESCLTPISVHMERLTSGLATDGPSMLSSAYSLFLHPNWATETSSTMNLRGLPPPVPYRRSSLSRSGSKTLRSPTRR